MGPSLGGMVVLAFAALFPGRGAARCCASPAPRPPRRLRSRCARSSARPSPRDPAWKGGNYSPDAAAGHRQRLARKLGTVTYRSAAEWQQRFGREPIRADMARTTRLPPSSRSRAISRRSRRRFVSAFDANCYLYLSRAMDRFELDKHGDPVTLLRRANLESALVIGVQSDLLFSVSEQQAIAHALEHAGVATRFAPLTCIEGHDAFLVDLKTFGGEIGAFLQSP